MLVLVPQALLCALFLSHVDAGRLSIYAPNDGSNSGNLACGGTFTRDQVHIAYRNWRKVGCKTPVLVCSGAAGRCVLARVMDAGPFGIYKPPLRYAVREGRWRVWLERSRPPAPWRYRAAADLSIGLWQKLGRPPFLSDVTLLFYKRRPAGFSGSRSSGSRLVSARAGGAVRRLVAWGPSSQALWVHASDWPSCLQCPDVF